MGKPFTADDIPVTLPTSSRGVPFLPDGARCARSRNAPARTVRRAVGAQSLDELASDALLTHQRRDHQVRRVTSTQPQVVPPERQQGLVLGHNLP